MLNNLEIKLKPEHIGNLLKGMKLEYIFHGAVKVTILPENHGYFVKPDDFYVLGKMFDVKMTDQGLKLLEKIKNYNKAEE